MKFTKEWKVKDISRKSMNDQIYDGIDPIINPYIDDATTNSRAYDAKLLAREIVDNVYKYDTAFSINLYFEVIDKNGQTPKVVIKITHNGSDFDPFDPSNDCKLIKKIKDDIKFIQNISLGDSMKRKMSIEFDLK